MLPFLLSYYDACGSGVKLYVDTETNIKVLFTEWTLIRIPDPDPGVW
jgi:hypothetical protein